SPPLFYPYGEQEGDTLSPKKDDGSSPAIPLLRPFSFFGQTYSQIYVNHNGDLTFNQSLRAYKPEPFASCGKKDIIAALWTDLDNSLGGAISYSQSTDVTLLSRASKDINQYFPGLNFTASWVFIATWDKVPYFKDPEKVRSEIFYLFFVIFFLLLLFYKM
ncbi:hypothetical protein NFI96_032418, partial [Prochilodus magdalenae]